MDQRAAHPHCPNCGLEFEKPLAWSARCPSCGRLLHASRKEVAENERVNSPGLLRRGIASLFRIGAALGALAAVLFVVASVTRPPGEPQPAVVNSPTVDRPRRQGDAAAQFERQRQIAECHEGDMATTVAHGTQASFPVGYATLRFFYNPMLAPEAADEARMAALIANAAGAWSACGIRGEYAGATQEQDAAGGALVFQWYNSDGVPVAGYRKGSTIYLNIAAFQKWHAASAKFAQEALQQVISHEMGHAFGVVEHSARCLDVMATYDSFDGCETRPAANRVLEDGGRVFEFKGHLFPTACDIQRCRKVNAMPARTSAGRP
jgi:hypothetical protein